MARWLVIAAVLAKGLAQPVRGQNPVDRLREDDAFTPWVVDAVTSDDGQRATHHLASREPL